jgi:NADH pyrophosphatase NudC (nudix superfamily)
MEPLHNRILRETMASLHKLKQGYRWCGGCGKPEVAPEEQGSRCKACEDVLSKFCEECGEELEMKRVDFARRKGGQCRRCFYCSRGMTLPHPVHKVKVPQGWYFLPLVVDL